MAVDAEIDLWASCTVDTILQVRSGKLKKYKGLNIESGIDKSLINGPVHIGSLGIEGDEHDLTFHGGVDKAIHGCELLHTVFLHAISHKKGKLSHERDAP